MKIKNKAVYLMSIISLLGGLTGCGNNKSDGVEVIFWHTFGKTIITELESHISEFEDYIQQTEGKKVKVTLKYQGGYDDILRKVRDGFSVGTTPTMAIAYPDHVAEYMQAEKTPGQFVVNLDNYMNDPEYGFGTEEKMGDTAGKDDIVADFLAEGQQYKNSGTYSLPLMKSTEIMFYNKTLVQKVFSYYNPSILGDQIDEFMSTMTWSQFMDICKVAVEHKSDISPTLEEPFRYDSDSNFFITQLSQSGYNFLSTDESGNPVLAFDSAEAKEVVRGLKANYDEGLFTTKGVEGTYGSDAFTKGECIFTVGSSGGAGYNFPTGDSFEVGIAKVPAISNENAKYITQGPTVTLLRNSKLSDEKNDEAVKYGWRFLKYLLTPNVNVSICINSEGYIPVRESCYKTEDYNTFLDSGIELSRCASVVINQIDGHYITNPVFRGSATARNEAGGILTQVFLGNKTIDAAFSDAVNQTRLAM